MVFSVIADGPVLGRGEAERPGGRIRRQEVGRGGENPEVNAENRVCVSWRHLMRIREAETVSPNLIDGLCVAGRLVPILSAKHLLIRAERTRRAKAGQTQGRARGHGSPAPQGMPRTD